MTLLTRVFSLIMIGLGLAMIVIAADRADVLRGVIGAAFIAVGVLRLHLQRERS
jgi:hypothetical protein